MTLFCAKHTILSINEQFSESTCFHIVYLMFSYVSNNMDHMVSYFLFLFAIDKFLIAHALILLI